MSISVEASPSYVFTRTREELRNAILRKLGQLPIGQTPRAEHSTIVYEAMDLRLKELHAKGALWFNVSGATSDVSLVSGTATVNAASDVLFPVTMNLRIGTEDKELRIIGHREYQEIPNKLDQAEPEMVFFSGGVYRFWPVPDANYTAKLTYQQVAADTAASTAPDVQVSMMRAFKCVVAYDLVDDFMLQDEQKILRLKAESEEGLRTIYALNQERTDAGTTTAEYF
jgi:hypothetical protein